MMGSSVHLDMSNPGVQGSPLPYANNQKLGYEIDDASHAAWWDENTSRIIATKCQPCIMRCRSRVWLPGFQPSPLWQPIRYVKPWLPNGQLRPSVRIPRGPLINLESLRARGVIPKLLSVGEGRFKWMRPVSITF
jgi:hypothetical protein